MHSNTHASRSPGSRETSRDRHQVGGRLFDVRLLPTFSSIEREPSHRSGSGGAAGV